MLRAHPEAQPNQPLTLEELRKMDGQPVWVKDLHYSDYSGWWIIGWPPNGYCVLASAMRVHMGYSVENYGIDWLAYRRPSKEDAELMAWLYGDLVETVDAAEPQMMPERVAELAQAERAGRLVVLPDGDDTAVLAATITSTDMFRVWCGGDGDLLLGLLSVLAGEVAQKGGTSYRNLLMSMARNKPVGDMFREYITEEGKSDEKG